jgi:hypothetical protein
MDDRIMDSSIIPALASLIGVGFGSAATLISQYLTTRVTARAAEAQRADALRAERKETILHFLAVVQDAESIAERWRSDGHRDRDEALSTTHRLWLAQKELDIVCSERLREPAFVLTRSLRDAIWKDSPEIQEALWHWLRGPRAAFMDTARQELGTDQPTEPG